MSKHYSGRHPDDLQNRRRAKKPSKSSVGRGGQSNRSLRRTLRRFLGNPEDLDIRGLGRKLCEVLGVRSGDMIEFHVLADGSVRIVNYGNR